MNIHFLAPGHGVHIHNITYFFQNTQIPNVFFNKSFGPASFFSPYTLSASADAQITTAVPLTATMSIEPLAPMVS